MMPGVCGLLIAALLFCCTLAGVQSQEARDKRQTTLSPIMLTNDRPTASFAIEPETLASAPAVLALSITKVVNPAKIPFGIFVYLSPAGEKGCPKSEKILVGNFSLYPPDHPAGFLLRASNAFRKLEAEGPRSRSSEVRLLLEMKRVRETKPWTPVEVTVAPPEWRSDERE